MAIHFSWEKKAPKKAKKGRFQEIQDLPEDDRIRVEHMFFSGYSAPQVAEYMQKELGLFKGTPLKSASRTMRAFKAKVIRPRACAIANASPKGNTEGERAMTEQVNVALELNRLIGIQDKRITGTGHIHADFTIAYCTHNIFSYNNQNH